MPTKEYNDFIYMMYPLAYSVNDIRETFRCARMYHEDAYKQSQVPTSSLPIPGMVRGKVEKVRLVGRKFRD